MSATTQIPAQGRVPTPAGSAPARSFSRAEGVEQLGPMKGTGYREGSFLVRRSDGRMVQLGPVLNELLGCLDRPKTAAEAASDLTGLIGRRVRPDQAARLLDKLADQGLLAGTEDAAPPPPNPLMALRWKVLVTRPRLTAWLTAPFTVLFRPWIMWPSLAGFAAVAWFVLGHKGVASATAQAFRDPGLLLLVFALGVLSAGFHELGHAAACRYGGAEARGFGMGLYLVWPCFYTDVTDAYRLPRRDRLRVDLAGLYFNALVAVVTMLVWLAWRNDALFLLVALQILQMVKQLSPVIRADGYHILSDATGVPDLYAHMGPTLRSLIPGRRGNPGALHGRTRALVTAWVLVMVPVLASLMIGAVLLLPRLLSSAWDTSRRLVDLVPQQVAAGQTLSVGADVVQLLAVVLPAVGSVLIIQRSVRTYAAKARRWSSGRPRRQAAVVVLAAAAAAGLAYAWWPSGQYRPVRGNERWTIPAMVTAVTHPQQALRPNAADFAAPAPGTYLALAMVPVGGATARHPALFILPGRAGHPPVAVMSSSAPGTESPGPAGAGPTPSRVAAAAFPFRLPAPAGPGDTQAVAVGTRAGGVVYDIAYSLVTVDSGLPVTNRNSAYALADCSSCTTVGVSFQVVLVVGQSSTVAPVDTAEALNSRCPACATTAIADQIVVTLKSQPSRQLIEELTASLRRLDALSELGAQGTPQAVAAQVTAIQQQIEGELAQSGEVATSGTNSASGSTSTSTSTSSTTTSTSTTTTPAAAPTVSGSSTGSASSWSASGSSSSTTSTTTSTSVSGSSSPGSSTTSTTDPSGTTTSTTSPPTTAAASGSASGTSG